MQKGPKMPVVEFEEITTTAFFKIFCIVFFFIFFFNLYIEKVVRVQWNLPPY